MTQFAQGVLICICILTGAVAQPPLPRHPPDSNSFYSDPRFRELIDESLERQAESDRQQRVKESQREFVENAEHFIQLWNQFASEYNQKRAFNIKLAKELSQAFRKLERTTGWPMATLKKMSLP